MIRPVCLSLAFLGFALPLSGAATPTEPGTLEIELRDEREAPKQDPELWACVVERSEARWQRLAVSKDGRARLSVPSGPGLRSVLVLALDEERCGLEVTTVERSTGRLPVEAPLVLRLAPRVNLRGLVTEADGSAAGGVPVRLRATHDDARRSVEFRRAAESVPEALGSAALVAEAKSGSDGRFEVPALCPGLWSAQAQPDGVLWPEGRRFVLPRPREETKAGGATAPDLVVRLPEGLALRGRVSVPAEKRSEVDEATVPLEGAELSLELYAMTDTSSRRVRLRAVSDAEGRFVFRGLPVTSATLRASAGGHAPAERIVSLPHDGELRLALRPSASALLPLAPEGEARPPTRVRVVVLHRREGRWEPPRDEEARELDFPGEVPLVLEDLPPEAVVLRVEADGFLPAWTEPAELRPGERRELPTLLLRRGRSVRGRVVDEATAVGIPAARIATDGPRRKGHRRPQRTQAQAQAESPSAESGANGRFLLQGLRSGLHRLRVEAPGYGSGSESRPVIRLDETWNDEEDELVVSLRRASELSVRVLDRDGAPVPGSLIVLGRTDGSGGATGTTGPAGEPHVFSPLDAGRWTVQLKNDSGLVRNGQEITLEPGRRGSLALEETGARVHGLVRSDGRPVPALVNLGRSPNQGFFHAQRRPEFELRDVPAGRHVVTVSRPLLTPDGAWSESRFSYDLHELVVPEGVETLEWNPEVKLSEADPDEGEDPPPVRVEGRLVDAQTGEGVELGVEAVHWMRGRVQAPSGPDGRFALTLAQHGQWRLQPNIVDDFSWYFAGSAPVDLLVAQGELVDAPEPLLVPVARPWLLRLRLTRAGLPLAGAECRPLEGFWVDEESGTVRTNAGAQQESDSLGFTQVRVESDEPADLACVAPGLGLLFPTALRPGRGLDAPLRQVSFGDGAVLEIDSSACSGPVRMTEPFTDRGWTFTPALSLWLRTLAVAGDGNLQLLGWPAGAWRVRAEGCPAVTLDVRAGETLSVALEPEG